MKRLIFLAIIILTILAVYGCSTPYINFSKDTSPYNPPTPHFKNKKLALVLGGGGAKGFAHVGVLEELNRAGIKPDLIVGCSAGAMIGALYAADPNIEHLKQIVLNGKSSDVLSTTLADWPYGIYSQDLMRQYLQDKLKTHDFKKLQIPFVATATNLQFGNLTAFSNGDLVTAVLASAAYPGAFKPVMIEGQYFVDCGVSNPVPVTVARELGFETIIAVNIAERLPKSAPKHLVGVTQRSLEIAYMNLSEVAVSQADIIIDFEFLNIGIFSDKHNQYLYEHGKLKTKAKLQQIRKRLNIKKLTSQEK